MSFKTSDCAIPSVWCGKRDTPKGIVKNIKYYRKGSPYECVRKGFAAGSYKMEKNSLPKNSLRQIKYVGVGYEEKFIENDVDDLDKFIQKAFVTSKKDIEKFLKFIFKNKKGLLDKRAYNSTLLYLYHRGVDVPNCSRI